MLLIVAWQGVCTCEYISLCVCLCTVCAHVCVHMGLCEGEIMRSCSAEAWSWSPEALDSFQWETSEQSEYETEHLWQKRKIWSHVEGSKRTMSLLCALSLYESRMKAFVLQCRENFFDNIALQGIQLSALSSTNSSLHRVCWGFHRVKREAAFSELWFCAAGKQRGLKLVQWTKFWLWGCCII